VIFYFIFFSVRVTEAQIVINEILASNTSTNLDDKTKNFVDWIELYNDGDKEISIGHWYLTDDKLNPTKWEIPFYISIAPKGFKLFWLDDLNTSNHTNFKLNIDGESVYLFNKNSILVDSIKYPPQVSDISYGRTAGSLQHLRYFHEITPMKENPTTGNIALEFAEQPIFSVKAGFYKETFELQLSVTNDIDEIFYTIDGSKPTKK